MCSCGYIFIPRYYFLQLERLLGNILGILAPRNLALDVLTPELKISVQCWFRLNIWLVLFVRRAFIEAHPYAVCLLPDIFQSLFSLSNANGCTCSAYLSLVG